MEEHISLFDKVVEEIESTPDIKTTNETVVKDIKDIGQIFNETLSINEVASDLKEIIDKAKIELNSRYI